MLIRGVSKEEWLFRSLAIAMVLAIVGIALSIGIELIVLPV
jgi:hypothetical protein